jgi:hypothetical protein
MEKNAGWCEKIQLIESAFPLLAVISPVVELNYDPDKLSSLLSPG